MNYRYILLMLFVFCESCHNNNKTTGNTTPATIHKVWEFKKIDTGLAPGNLGSIWIGENTLDLTNNDTLRFSYKNNKGIPTSYAYKIGHDTIFVKNGMTYKILKLTDNELRLANSFKVSNSKDSTTIVMVYGAK